jgi:glycosyltransferase involved in cell wall biosynthesis
LARPIKILINAQLAPGGKWGGVEQFVMGLVHALGRLTDGEEQYTLITRAESPDWLRPFMGPNQTSVTAPPPKSGGAERLKRLLGPLRTPAAALLHAIRRFLDGSVGEDALAGFYDSLGGEIIHFPFQEFAPCRMPFIYNPWDLQHLHNPQFFSAGETAFRGRVYASGCHAAQAVVAPTCAVKADLERQYGLNPQKIFVIHCAPPAAVYEAVTEDVLRKVRERYRLPASFGVFPAQTWPSKNHLRLLEAVRQARDRNATVLNLVCTGTKNEHWPAINQRIHELGLEAQVMFLGFVDALELRALYRLAQFVVFPSLFEGAGLPVIEALAEGVAVACSDIAPLREYGGDAVLTFDPRSAESIAASLLRISIDEGLREQLRAQGKERAKLFTWERTGKSYRALYRKVAGVPLSEEDALLLGSDNVTTGSS